MLWISKSVFNSVYNLSRTRMIEWWVAIYPLKAIAIKEYILLNFIIVKLTSYCLDLIKPYSLNILNSQGKRQLISKFASAACNSFTQEGPFQGIFLSFGDLTKALDFSRLNALSLCSPNLFTFLRPFSCKNHKPLIKINIMHIKKSFLKNSKTE